MVMLYQVRDLSPEQKQAAEVLLGHPFVEGESISINRLSCSPVVPSKLSPEERIEAIKALDARFAARPRPDVSEEEEEEAYIEAMRSVRPNFTPVK